MDSTLQLVILKALNFLIIIAVLRALSWPDGWRERKPLACNACMAGWCSIGLWLHGDIGASTAAAAGGLTYLLLSWLESLRSTSWPLPPG